jgi:hypothetical protein
MNIEDIKNKDIIGHVLNILSETPDIKAKYISIEDQNNNPYIHFDINMFDKNRIEVTYATNSFVNDEEEDPDNDKYIEILGLDPEAILKGPIKYKEIEEIYEYFYGPANDIIDEDQKVFFCIGESLQKKLKEKYKSF